MRVDSHKIDRFCGPHNFMTPHTKTFTEYMVGLGFHWFMVVGGFSLTARSI